ncbi:MAG: BlaI/MecI/CopY family transcriptional regulator [Planctomycetes bacterium]|nr:BlaI/MecI/CopY family transcriptional regulator [Planctomycetota bacterium]
MADRPTYRLGDLQLKIMRVLWELGAARVVDVQRQLDGDQLAYTTIATMLRKMEDRGLVQHKEQQRKFIYEPLVSADEVTRCMADDIVDRLFDGSLADTVSHLLRTREVSHDELEQLERLIKQRRRKRV